MEATKISARWLASDRKDWNWALGSCNLTRIKATVKQGQGTGRRCTARQSWDMCRQGCVEGFTWGRGKTALRGISFYSNADRKKVRTGKRWTPTPLNQSIYILRGGKWTGWEEIKENRVGFGGEGELILKGQHLMASMVNHCQILSGVVCNHGNYYRDKYLLWYIST